MNSEITNGPLNGEKFAVTGHSILKSGRVHRWTEWYASRAAAEADLQRGEQLVSGMRIVPEMVHELAADEADRIGNIYADKILSTRDAE